MAAASLDFWTITSIEVISHTNGYIQFCYTAKWVDQEIECVVEHYGTYTLYWEPVIKEPLE